MLTPHLLSQKLAAELSRGADKVKKLDPFKQIDEGQAQSKKAAGQAAARWARKTPEDKTSKVDMHWATFDAIVKRKGGPYSTKGKERIEYDFPQTM